MSYSPDTARRLVKVSGIFGVLFTVVGYIGLQGPGRPYHTAAMLAFYGGFALMLSAVVIWYWHVPPRPPAPEEPEPVDKVDDSED
jgi:hypothetical protein